MRTRLPLVVTLLFLAFPPGASAQGPVAAELPWPDSWSPDGPEASAQSQERLPVYDERGQVIPFEEIEARVDVSGASGAFWGGLLGLSVGLAIGAAAAPDCPRDEGGLRYFCSPQDEALKERLPTGLGIAFGALMALAGWNSDRTTFEEAIEQIRRERRTGIVR